MFLIACFYESDVPTNHFFVGNEEAPPYQESWHSDKGKAHKFQTKNKQVMDYLQHKYKPLESTDKLKIKFVEVPDDGSK